MSKREGEVRVEREGGREGGQARPTCLTCMFHSQFGCLVALFSVCFWLSLVLWGLSTPKFHTNFFFLFLLKYHLWLKHASKLHSELPHSLCLGDFVDVYQPISKTYTSFWSRCLTCISCLASHSQHSTPGPHSHQHLVSTSVHLSN